MTQHISDDADIPDILEQLHSVGSEVDGFRDQMILQLGSLKRLNAKLLADIEELKMLRSTHAAKALEERQEGDVSGTPSDGGAR